MHLYRLWLQGLERWQLGIHTFILQPKGTIKEVIHDIKNLTVLQLPLNSSQKLATLKMMFETQLDFLTILEDLQSSHVPTLKFAISICKSFNKAYVLNQSPKYCLL